jgi:hypothetical protein
LQVLFFFDRKKNLASKWRDSLSPVFSRERVRMRGLPERLFAV